MRPIKRHLSILGWVKGKLRRPRPEALPWVGLGVDHGGEGEVNLKAQKWAIKELKGLRRRGYTRTVIEGGDGFFDPVAKRARRMGYTVERESRAGHRAHGRIRNGKMWGLSGRMAYIRSQYMADSTFRQPKTVLLGGTRHLLHAEDYIVPEEHPKLPFEARYYPKVKWTRRELARLDWEDFCRAAGRRGKRQEAIRAKKGRNPKRTGRNPRLLD
jgi:hypothetical protein